MFKHNVCACLINMFYDNPHPAIMPDGDSGSFVNKLITCRTAKMKGLAPVANKNTRTISIHMPRYAGTHGQIAG